MFPCTASTGFKVRLSSRSFSRHTKRAFIICGTPCVQLQQLSPSPTISLKGYKQESFRMLSVTAQLVLAVFLFTGWSDVTPVQCKSVEPLKKEVWNELNCNKPQSRLAYLEDEYPDYNSDAVYLPHAAVVQYCDSSLGCCRKGHRYVPTKEEKTTFAFQEILHGKKMKKEIVLTNHSRCVCQSVGSHHE